MKVPHHPLISLSVSQFAAKQFIVELKNAGTTPAVVSQFNGSSLEANLNQTFSKKKPPFIPIIYHSSGLNHIDIPFLQTVIYWLCLLCLRFSCQSVLNTLPSIHQLNAAIFIHFFPNDEIIPIYPQVFSHAYFSVHRIVRYPDTPFFIFLFFFMLFS